MPERRATSAWGADNFVTLDQVNAQQPAQEEPLKKRAFSMVHFRRKSTKTAAEIEAAKSRNNSAPAAPIGFAKGWSGKPRAPLGTELPMIKPTNKFLSTFSTMGDCASPQEMPEMPQVDMRAAFAGFRGLV